MMPHVWGVAVAKASLEILGHTCKALLFKGKTLQFGSLFLLTTMQLQLFDKQHSLHI
jgi:hypothetical protein